MYQLFSIISSSFHVPLAHNFDSVFNSLCIMSNLLYKKAGSGICIGKEWRCYHEIAPVPSHSLDLFKQPETGLCLS